ncbi:pyridoxal 5'-phosphate synthase glutaminase subunit PdxT [Patescibacteria group bacterium]
MPKEVGKIRIGVLALQGDFIEHINILYKLGVETCEVRTKEDLKGLNGLIIPGGESTTMNLLIGEIKTAAKKLPIFGTCAGAILLAQHGFMDIEIERNAYGSQLDSFEDEFEFNDHKVHGIFIRAPKIKSVGPDVEVLARNSRKDIVFVRQGKYLAATFHPELTDNTKIHEYFLKMITQNL